MNTMGKSSPGTGSTEAGLPLSTVWGYRAPGSVPPPPTLTALGSARRCSHAGQGKSWHLHPPALPAPGPGRGPLCPASPAALSHARTCAHTCTHTHRRADAHRHPPCLLPRCAHPPPTFRAILPTLLPPPWSWEPLGWGRGGLGPSGSLQNRLTAGQAPGTLRPLPSHTRDLVAEPLEPRRGQGSRAFHRVPCDPDLGIRGFIKTTWFLAQYS